MPLVKFIAEHAGVQMFHHLEDASALWAVPCLLTSKHLMISSE